MSRSAVPGTGRSWSPTTRRVYVSELEAATGKRVAAPEAIEPAADKSATKEDPQARGAAIEIERTTDRPDADSGRYIPQDVPEPSQRDPEPEKIRNRRLEMGM